VFQQKQLFRQLLLQQAKFTQKKVRDAGWVGKMTLFWGGKNEFKIHCLGENKK